MATAMEAMAQDGDGNDDDNDSHCEYGSKSCDENGGGDDGPGDDHGQDQGRHGQVDADDGSDDDGGDDDDDVTMKLLMLVNMMIWRLRD